MKLYADRDVIEQGQVYMKHVQAMTAEQLHSKSDIAAELAHRDIDILKLRKLLAYSASIASELYTDDGELQDNAVQPTIDYLRDDPDAIYRKLLERHGNMW